MDDPMARITDSEFDRKFPAVKVTYWHTINSARNILSSNSKELLLIRCELDSCKNDLAALHYEKSSGFYGNYQDCIELKQIQEALEDVIEQLLQRAKELDISVKNDSFDIA